MDRNSGAKRRLFITDDDVLSHEKPALKSVKREAAETVPLREVTELRQKVAKLEKDNQKACRLAREYELRLEQANERVASLEELIDKKEAAVDGGEKKLLAELQTRLAETSTKLEEATRKEKNAKITELEMSQQIDELEEERRKDRKRIDELTRKLAQFASEMLLPTTVSQEATVPQQAQVVSGASDNAPVIVENAQETDADESFDILAVLPMNAPDSVPYSIAVPVERLLVRFFPTDSLWLQWYNATNGNESLYCNECKKSLYIKDILAYLFSNKHANVLRLQFGAVSMGAFEYWLDKLQQIPNPPPPSRLNLETPTFLPKMKHNLQMPKLKRQNMGKVILTKVKPQPKNFGNKPYVVMLDADIPD